MSLFYRNIISISRLPAATEDGAQPYARADYANAILIYSGLRADIQRKIKSKTPTANLPGDVENNYYYEIFIKNSSLARGSLFVHDFIAAQDGIIYQVVDMPYWTVFGYQTICERLII